MKTNKLIKTFDRIESIIPTIQNSQHRQKLEDYNYKLSKIILNHSIQ